ncbi:LLM class flavin-dependent oxidoreductase [Blastococcus sp. SYSU D00820]
MRVGLSIPVMDEPAALVEIGVAAEANGWDGVFLWHHVVGTPDLPMPIADAWVVLGALAVRTSRVRLGTTITALPRHQPQEVARQAVTVDRLSGGRMTLGVGLGEPPAEYTALGRSADRATLAALLDEGLEVVSGLWSAEPFSHAGAHYTVDGVQFLPPPLQQPRIPVWTSAMTRTERTLGRAARWDGVILGAMTAEGGMDVLPPEAVAEVAARPDAPADVVVATPTGTDPATYADAGATWVLVTGWLDELREAAAAAPRSVPRPRRDGSG